MVKVILDCRPGGCHDLGKSGDPLLPDRRYAIGDSPT